MDKLTEQILIAEWLHGDKTEDIDEFIIKDFKRYPKVVGAIKEYGTDNPYDFIKKEILTMEEYLEITAQYSPTLYDSAMGNLMAEKAKEWISENPDAKPREIAEKMLDFSSHTSELPGYSKEPVLDFIAEMDRRRSEKIITTGLTQLDELLFGIRTGELTFVGARPSVGKSAFLLQMALTVAEQGKKVLYLSLEMSEMAMWQRIFMRYTKTPVALIRRGFGSDDWTDERQMALEKMQNLYQSGNFILIPNARDINTIKELVKQHQPYMLLVDQLQQMDDRTKHFKDVRSRFAHMTRELQELALDKNIAVWCACQINRSANETMPTMANLKEAGNIEEDATNVILLHRESEKTEIQEIRCELAKQKEGACGDFLLSFNAPRFTFMGTTSI